MFFIPNIHCLTISTVLIIMILAGVFRVKWLGIKVIAALWIICGIWTIYLSILFLINALIFMAAVVLFASLAVWIKNKVAGKASASRP